MDRLAHAHTRDKLQGELRREVPDLIWERLVAKRYVDEAEDPSGDEAEDPSEWEILVDEAKFLLACMEEGARGRTPHRIPAAAKEPLIEARGRALGAWAARYARGDMFTGLRDRGAWLEAARGYLGGVFSRNDAVAHLGSDAWKFVPLPDLVARHPFDRLTPDDAPRIRGTTARVRSTIDETFNGSPGIRIEIEVRYGREVRELSVWRRSGARFVWAAIPGLEPVRTIAADGSLNERLWVIADRDRWGPMTVPETLWFILTDEPPEIRPLVVDVRQELGPDARPRDIVTVEAEPWVPVHAVAAAYREAQLERLRGRNHPPRERSLELARFLAKEGWGLSIRRQMGAWNRLHPEWAKRDARNFRKDALRAKIQLLGAP